MNNVEVYVLSIKSILDTPINPLLPLFSSSAQQRILKYRFAADQNRTAYAELLVRYLLSRKTNTPMSQIHLERDAFGKPYWAGSNCHFNLSHSGEFVACSIGQVVNGIDVETAEIADCDIAQNFFLPKEYKHLLTLPESERKLSFLKMWTVKESYLKCTGQGLSAALQTIDYFELTEGRLPLAANVFVLSSTAVLAICTEKQYLPTNIIHLKRNVLL